MEPVMVFALGLMTMVGQLHNYGINVEKHPHLKDVRVRRSEPYSVDVKDQNSIKAVQDTKQIETDYELPTPKDKGQNSIKHVQFITENDEIYSQPFDIDNKNIIPVTDDAQATQDDVLPEEIVSIESILKGDRNIVRKKRRAYTPIAHIQQKYNQGQSGYNNGYSQGNNGYSPGNNGYSQGNNGYSQGNTGYSQGNNGYSQGNNGYIQGNNGYSQGNSGYGRDFVDDIVDNAERLADGIINNKMAGSDPTLIHINKNRATTERPAFNNVNIATTNYENNGDSGPKYPDANVYTHRSKSVHTYEDDNVQGITLTNTNINIVQPKRNRTVYHKNTPGYNLTVISDVPANSQSSKVNNNGNRGNNGYNGNSDDSNLYNNNRQNSRNQGTAPKPVTAYNEESNSARNNKYGDRYTTQRNYPTLDNERTYIGNNERTYDTPQNGYSSNNENRLQNNGYISTNNGNRLPNNGYISTNNGYSTQNYGSANPANHNIGQLNYPPNNNNREYQYFNRKKRSYNSYYQQMNSQMAAAGQQINQANKLYGTNYKNPYNSYTTKRNEYESNTITEVNNKHNVVLNATIAKSNDSITGYNYNLPNNKNSGKGYNTNNANNIYGYSPYGNGNKVTSTTTEKPRINQSQVLRSFGCAKFMKYVSIFGQRLCVPEDSVEDVDSDEFI